MTLKLQFALGTRRTEAILALALCGLAAFSIDAKGASAQEKPRKAATWHRDLATKVGEIVARRKAALGSDVRIGVLLVDADSRRDVFSHNAGENFAAASNAKIVSAAAALKFLGPEFAFRTEILGQTPNAAGVVPGPIYLRGRGNAGFDDQDLEQLTESLAALGIKKVDSIVVDNSYFDNQNLPPHFDEQPEENAAFRAPIAATLDDL